MRNASTSGSPRGPFVLHAKFAAYLGWSQPFLHSLIGGLIERGDGAVLCQRRENRERFPLERFLAVEGRVLAYPLLAIPLAACIRESWNPAILHAHFGWSGVRSLLLRSALDVPMVVTFGGRDAGAELHSERWRETYRAMLDQVTRVIAVSDALAGELADAGVPDSRIELIRRGCDLDFFTAEERPERAATEPLRLLMVGRLVEKKAHVHAVEALAKLRGAGVPAVLRIVGDGPRKRHITVARRNAGLPPEAVEIAPRTDRSGVREHYRWADLFVHCSVQARDGDEEGIPNVVVEAAATGLPVVGTRHGGIPETIRAGETGWLIAESDVDALRNAIEEAARRPDDRRARGRAGAALMHREFSLRHQLDRHEAVYEEVLAAPRATPPLPVDFIGKLQEVLLDSGAMGRPDHRSLAVAQRAARWLDGNPASSNGRRERAPAPLSVPGNGVPAPSATSWSSFKQLVKTGLGPLGPVVASWRQELHYLRVAREQDRIERRFWEVLRTGEVPDGAVPQGIADRLAVFVREAAASPFGTVDA